VFGDADKIRPFNPLVRVPVLVLDDGSSLIETLAIIDHLDRLVAEEQVMFPLTEPGRREALKIAALAGGLADKAVSLFYEKRLHGEKSEVWMRRCQSQIFATMAVLEAERVQRTSEFWFGDRIGHADIAVAAALRFLGESHPGLVDFDVYPALRDHAARLEALAVFQEISQPFNAPA